MDEGLLLARLILGLGLAAHGAQKLFGWFGGHGLAGTGGFFESLGWKPGRLFALGAGLGEFGGGLLVALGLLGPVGPALIVMVMLVAALAVHLPNGFFNENRGFELPAIYIAGALALAFGGFGSYSLDAVISPGLSSSPSLNWILLAAAVVLAVLNVVARRQPAPPAP